METLSDKQYTEWISCLERIAQHPEFEKELAFLKGYRKELTKQTKVDELPSVTLEPDGRKSCFIPGTTSLLTHLKINGFIKLDICKIELCITHNKTNFVTI